LGNTHAATKVVHVPAGGSALILTVRISSGVEEDSKKGGVQMMLKQIHQDWSFQE
jgi:hypothetical protein